MSEGQVREPGVSYKSIVRQFEARHGCTLEAYERQIAQGQVPEHPSWEESLEWGVALDEIERRCEMAQDVMTLKAEIISALDLLPPEDLRPLRDFVAFLRSRVEQPASRERVVKLGGLWAGTPEITEEDIAEARREMWGRFGEREV